MDAVRAAHAQQPLMLKRQLLQDGQQAVEAFEDKLTGLHHEQGTRRIHDVRRGAAQMDETGNRAHLFLNGRKERDDVMARGFLNLDGTVHKGAIHGKIGVSAQDFHVGIGDFSHTVPCLAHGHFHAQPRLIAVFGGPDVAHFRAGVTFDHGFSSRKQITARANAHAATIRP